MRLSHGKPSYLFLVLVVAVQVAALAGSATAKPALVVAQDGLGSPNDCDSATPTPYTTIGVAVAPAAPPDLILICPRGYHQQGPITKPPPLPGENRAVV